MCPSEPAGFSFEVLCIMENVIAADVGNSSIELGLFQDNDLLFTERLQTQLEWTDRSMDKEIARILSEHQIKTQDLNGAILSSVVPGIDPILQKSLSKVTGRETVVMTTALKTGIGTALYDTSNFGLDRLADMSAAIAFYGSPSAVYDLGTCTTLSVTDRNADFIGGMISAGIQLSLDVQADRTAKLPQLSAAYADTLLGRDTRANMLSGSVAATGIMIDGVIDRIIEEYDLPDLKIILTGGNARYVLPWIRHRVSYDPDLLLKGLLSIYRRNS